uniref:Disease resistance protein RPS2-like n=1 Tax=Nelumbo nucifera TaxID=4432 RepID=A0A1U8Q259_NELNU
MKSLVALDLSCTHISSLPPSLPCLMNLHTLCLDSCTSLTDISMLGKLTALQLLSLSGSKIEKLPEEIGKLSNLKLLDLSHTYNLKTVPPNVISSLSRLEELNMKHSFYGWEVEGYGSGSNASFAELTSLECLTVLYVQVGNTRCLSKVIPFSSNNLAKFCISVDSSYHESSSPTYMYLKNLSIPVANWIKMLLMKTAELSLIGCDRIKNLVILDVCGVKGLKSLHVEDCSEMEYLINIMEEAGVPQSTFNSLEKLQLKNMENLKQICLCHGPLPNGIFGNLKVLRVQKCHRLDEILSHPLLKGLKILEELKVDQCHKLKFLFYSKELQE